MARAGSPSPGQLGRQAGAEVREHDVGAGQEAVDDAPGRTDGGGRAAAMLAPVREMKWRVSPGASGASLAHRVAVDRSTLMT